MKGNYAAMIEPAYASLRLRHEAGLVSVTIDHPPLNILDVSLLTQLDALAAALTTDAETRVVVFESANPEFFCVHGDMAFVSDPQSFSGLDVGDGSDADLNPMMRLLEHIRRLPQVTIGKLKGLARGGGSELLMALDMRFAAIETAGIAQMEALTAIIPGAGATAHLPRLVGRSRALEIVLGCEVCDAATAERYGWINRALPAATIDEHVAILARRIAGLPEGVVTAAKGAIDAGTELSLAQALRIENEQLGITFSRPAATARTLEALRRGAQTREGELRLESLLNAF